MKKKLPILLICNLVLALIMFAKVSIKEGIFAAVKENTSDMDTLYSSNNSMTIIAMIIIGVVISIMFMTKSNTTSELCLDILLIGVPGIVLSSWWKFLAVTGYGFFCSYQEIMAYVGSLLVGVCIVKIVTFFLAKRK